jgi:succinyldiaminopimelate transaminase
VTAGTPELRAAITNWAKTKLKVTGEFDVLPLIGSKELVAWLPTLLQSKSVNFPEIAYPTYRVGAILAGASEAAVAISPEHWPQADLSWVNSPANPTGRVHNDQEYLDVIEWSRANNSILVSDECYLEFGDDEVPTSILQYTNGNNHNILAVHSLSKRSSMAGYRGAFLIGDKDLIARIREVRKHAGMMVPLPIQKAMTIALSDEIHVAEQRSRYNARRAVLVPALKAAGFQIEYSNAGLYIWCTRQESDWESVSWLANLGILATPGNFYGELGNSHIRIAMTATDLQISEAAERINIAVRGYP